MQLLALLCLTDLAGCSLLSPPVPIRPAPPVAAKTNPAKPNVTVAPPTPPPQVAAANTDRVKVALLLPLTGKSAKLGQAMLDAANLAVFDIAGKNFELLPEDTSDTPDGAKKAADHAVAAGAKLILGPLFSSSVAAVRPVTSAAGLNVISFSTDATQAGDNVFVMGFLPATQVDRVAQYAISHGVAHIAALAPETPYGNTALAALQTDLGGNLAAVARYTGDGDLTPQLQTVTASGMPQGLFIPEGGDWLHSIARSLAPAGIDPATVRLLGTGLWDDPALGQEPALVGGWYAGTAPAARADFEKRFNNTYHYQPQRLATLAYDATALAIVLSKPAQAGQNPFDKAAITKDSGFAGIDGIFRFQDNGLIERGLSVLQIAPTGPVVVDPAPKSFGGRMGM